MPVHRLKASPRGTFHSLRARTDDEPKTAFMEMDIRVPDAEWRLEERNLSIRLAFFRSPVGEALPLLNRDGIVKTISRRGVFIVNNSKREVLKLDAVWAGIEVSPADSPTRWQARSISRRWKSASPRLPAEGVMRRHDPQLREHVTKFAEPN